MQAFVVFCLVYIKQCRPFAPPRRLNTPMCCAFYTRDGAGRSGGLAWHTFSHAQLLLLKFFATALAEAAARALFRPVDALPEGGVGPPFAPFPPPSSFSGTVMLSVMSFSSSSSNPTPALSALICSFSFATSLLCRVGTHGSEPLCTPNTKI